MHTVADSWSPWPGSPPSVTAPDTRTGFALRDIADHVGPCASPLNTMAEAEHVMRRRLLGTLPMAEEHGSALGVLALSR